MLSARHWLRLRRSVVESRELVLEAEHLPSPKSLVNTRYIAELNSSRHCVGAVPSVDLVPRRTCEPAFIATHSCLWTVSPNKYRPLLLATRPADAEAPPAAAGNSDDRLLPRRSPGRVGVPPPLLPLPSGRAARASSLLEDAPYLAVLVHDGALSQVRLVRQAVQKLHLVIQFLAQALGQALEPPQAAVQLGQV